MQNLLLQLQSSILQHQLQSWLVHFAFFSRGHFWACLHHIQKGSFKRVTINITTAPQTLALPHQKISVKDKNLIFNKAVSYLQEYTKIRPKMTRKLCGPVDDCVGLADCGDEAVEKVCSLLWTSPRKFKHLDNHFLFNRRQFNWFVSISNLALAAWM